MKLVRLFTYASCFCLLQESTLQESPPIKRLGAHFKPQRLSSLKYTAAPHS